MKPLLCKFGWHRFVYIGEQREQMLFGSRGWNHKCARCGYTIWAVTADVGRSLPDSADEDGAR